MVNPYSAGTLTLQEAPSFAWRTNVSGVQPPRWSSDSCEARSVCNALLGGVSNSECFKSDAQWPRLRKGEIEFFKTDNTPSDVLHQDDFIASLFANVFF